MKKRIAFLSVLVFVAFSVTALLSLTAIAEKDGALAYHASLEKTAPTDSVKFYASAGSTVQRLQNGDSLAGQFVTTDAVRTLSLALSGKGNATLSLFSFDTDINRSMMAEPIAETTLTVSGSSYAVLTFAEQTPLPAGEYVLAVHDFEGGSLPFSGTHDAQIAYKNGEVLQGSLRIAAEYVETPNLPFGEPTKPQTVSFDEYAPHMETVLRFDTDICGSVVGGCNNMKVSFVTENGESFTRFSPTENASDPYGYLSLPSDTAKTEEYGYLLMKVRLDEGAPRNGQIYFKTDECDISEPASVHFTYGSGTDWQYLIVPLGKNSNYKGMLLQLRFDVFQEVSGMHYVDVAYMALFRTQKGAEAFHDNFEDYQEKTDAKTPIEPDYSTYKTADAPSQTEDGKLTANGKLNYRYKEYTYAMDFSETVDDYHAGEAFGFSGISDAIITDEQLRCRPYGATSFYTRQTVGDIYGLRGGDLSFDFSLTYGSLSVALRQIYTNDAAEQSGLFFLFAPDGTVTISERDGFQIIRKTGINFAEPHRLTFCDNVYAITLLCDERELFTITWDFYDQSLTLDNTVAFAQHLPGAGYASVSLQSMRGYIDNVTYTYVDIVENTNTVSYTVDYSTWVATDDLDRVTPTEEAGQGNDRVVGLFYFMCHSFYGGRSVNDVTRMYLNDGLESLKATLTSYAGRDGAYWAEPYFGYYSSDDEWVFRKHAVMLDAAGVDFIFLDLSNNVFYEEQVQLLFDTWLAIRRAGGSTPQIALMFGDMPFTFVNGVYTFQSLLTDPTYEELWFKWEGKTLILGNNDGTLATDKGTYRTWTVSNSTTPQSKETYKSLLKQNPEVGAFVQSKEINAFLENYTVRKCWAWQNSDKKTGLGYWDWLQSSPQNAGHDFDGNIEQMPVIMGTHAHTNSGRSLTSGDSSYDRAGDFGFSLGTAKYGYQFAESFEYALQQNVQVIMITGWNEWYAGVQKTDNQNQICGGTETPGYYMVDQMSPEYSRDGEPMRLRDGVGFGDNYYYQMVSYIRRFKGTATTETVNGGSMDIHATDIAAQWEGVTPLFTDTANDANLRSELSFAAEFKYTNATARNDIATAQISQDADTVYFFVTTTNALITADDAFWMNLYLNADGDNATGWEGYDYILNRSRTDKTVSIERFVDGAWVFETVGTAEYALCENGMMLAVDKELIGGKKGESLSFSFKWADNADIRGDVMCFMEWGDAAPNDRFAFSYLAQGVEDDRQKETTPPDTDTPDSQETEERTDVPAQENGCAGCGSMLHTNQGLLILAGLLLPHICIRMRKRRKMTSKK